MARPLGSRDRQPRQIASDCLDVTPLRRILLRMVADRSPEEVAEVIGVSGGSLHKLLHSARMVSIDRADELAVACGYHPIEVWGDEWLAKTAGEAC